MGLLEVGEIEAEADIGALVRGLAVDAAVEERAGKAQIFEGIAVAQRAQDAAQRQASADDAVERLLREGKPARPGVDVGPDRAFLRIAVKLRRRRERPRKAAPGKAGEGGEAAYLGAQRPRDHARADAPAIVELRIGVCDTK